MLPPCLPALQRSQLAQLGGTVATEAFVGLIFCLDPAVAFVCQCVKLIDLDHWSNSFVTVDLQCRLFYTFAHLIYVD